MSEDLANYISLGLLGLIAVLLLLVISRLARLERALNPWRSEQDTAETTPTPVSTPPEVDGALEVAAEPAPELPQEEEAVEGPFEKDGRWWYQRGDELLLYDERTESWVDPNEPTNTEQEPVASRAVGQESPRPAIKPHVLEEARGWDTAPIPETTPPPATVEPTSAAPIVEPVDPPVEPIAVTPAAAAPTEGDGTAAAAHWKCPSCGVINGSTATSCRMCFAARP